MKKELKEKIESIAFAIADSSRPLKLKTIIEYSGEEYETNDDFLQLASKTDNQLNFILFNILTYYLNE